MPGRCLACGTPSDAAATEFAGIKGDPTPLAAVACSDACADTVRRFAPRRSAQRQPAMAGYVVSVLGLVTALLFGLSNRDLGRALSVLGLLGIATSRLAYPDVLPLGLARRLGLARAQVALQWAGVALGFGAVALAAYYLLG